MRFGYTAGVQAITCSLLLIIVLCTAADSETPWITKIKTADGGTFVPNPKIELVGSFGKKFYFSENIAMNAYNAVRYCPEISPSMQLVMVDTQEELAYLTGYARNITIPAGEYWTGGQNTYTYVWPDGRPVEDLYLDREFTMCLSLRAANAAGERLWGVMCTDQLKPLCQVVAID